MKNWILTHKKLYFFIVGVIAFIAFSIITLFGAVRLANAATTDSAWFDADGNSIPDITTLDFSSYAEYFEEEYGYTGNIGSKIIADHKYCVVVINPYYWPYSSDYESNASAYFSFLFTDEPVIYESNTNYWLLADWNTSVSIELREGKIQYMRGYGMNSWDGTSFGYGTDLIPFVVNSNNSSAQVIASSYDLGDELYCHPSYVSITYPKSTTYSMDAPYVQFQRLNVKNRLASGDFSTLEIASPISNLFDYITEEAYWEYCGKIENFTGADDEYTVDISFVVEIPTVQYVSDWFDKNGVNSKNSSQIMRNMKYCVAEWNLTDSNEKYVFNGTATFRIIPNDAGYFTWRLSFVEIAELLIKNDPDALTLFNNLEDYMELMIMPGLHVDSVSTLLTTTSDDSVLVGRYVVDYFERGVLNDAMSVYIDLDSLNGSEEEQEEAIRNAVSDAIEEQNKELQDRVDGLEGELEYIYSVDGALTGDLSNTDLWDGFWNLSRGLANVSSSVSSLSVLTGSVFGFMPSPVTSIMQFTLVAICIIAIIKAIRG